MNEGLKKFEELVKTDAEVQKKLVTAIENYTGDRADEHAIFDDVLVPVVEEYGISATYEEFEEYLKQMKDREDLSDEELNQISGGGKAGGIGSMDCLAAGIGIGAGGGSGAGGVCLVIGVGDGEFGCAGKGVSE